MNQFYQQLATLTPEQRALLEKKLAAKGIEKSLEGLGNTAIPPRPQNQPVPLSFAQQRLWFVQQLDPDSTAYNVASVLQLQGTLNISALEKSLNALVARHEAFRTHFALKADANDEQQQPTQVISLPTAARLNVEDLRIAADPQSAASHRIHDLTQTPFDLTQPLLRTALLQVETNSYLLVLTTHHIISDRWSVMVFLREMTVLYRAFSQGQTSPLPPLKIQYADWAVWQRQQLQGEQLQQQIDYWKAQLSGELPVLELPVDRPYGPVATYQGSQVPFALSLELSEKLKALSGTYQVTLFTLLLTTCKVLLHRYTDNDDIIVGSDVANRDRTETEGLIGLLVNTLVFRSDLSNNPRFCDLLHQVRETVLSGLAHKDLPFEKLVEVINPERQLSQMMPLFQVKLDLQQVDVKPMQLDGLTLSRYPLAETQAKYELRFNLQDTPQGISGQVEYNSDLFDEKTISGLIEHFTTLLSGLVLNPEQPLSALPLLSNKEKETLLIDWNQTQRAYPTNHCIHQLFEAQVEKTPDAIALADTQISFTYAELNAQSNRVAHHLRSLGIGALSQTVGVCMERTCSMVVSLLAILKAGGAYTPLDPVYPAERLAFIAKDADIQVILTQGQETSFDTDQSLQIVDVNNVSLTLPATNLVTHSIPEDLAYVIYTSGSTGKPKGVAIEHRNTVTLLHWAKEQFSAAELSGVLASTSICFDLSVFEIFAPLSWGGCAIIVENALSLPRLSSPVPVSLLNTVPSVLTQLLKAGNLPLSIQSVNLAGEALPVSLVRQLQQLSHVQKIYNLYGPSEDTTYSTCALLHEQSFAAVNSRVPIGKPIANTQAYVLDRHRQPVPIGVAGELYLGGAGVARGYLNRPELTADRFVDDLYKTGDRVRYLPDGSLEFLGRLDHQIKIRGFRIETGEIETVLCQHPAVQAAVVIAYGEADKQLAAYVVPSGAASDTASEQSLQTQLRHDLEQQLPAYLVPTLWVELAALPQLPNGKIDRRSLPEPNAQTTDAYVAPRSDLEKTLITIWQTVLNKERIGIQDNFFELGGHSLLAIQIVGQAEAVLQRKIPLRAFFQSPTVAGLSAQLEENNAAFGVGETDHERRPQIAPDLAQHHQPFPLTDIQQAYWIGRSHAFELGNIGTHGYREIDVTGLGVEQIEQALNILIQRHDMLRAVVNTDGQQVILPEVPVYKIGTTDLSRGLGDNGHAQFTALRDRLSHQLFIPEQWPLFQIEAAQLPNNKLRVFISFDVLIGDAWSFQLLGQEMAQLIQGHRLSPLSLSFRDYVIAEQAFQITTAYEQALAYWKNRLETLPPSPRLPLTMAPSQIKSPRFERRSGRLDAAAWTKLKQRANQAALTPSGVVLSAFSEVLTTWSQQPQFTLNLTLFNRLPLHPEVNKIVGDFTASMLLAVDNSDKDTFMNRAQRLQQQLWEDLDNRAVSGVRVLRELAKQTQRQRGAGALMPVVFTSTLNQTIPQAISQADSRDWQTEAVFSVSQTSQVYLDHQVSEIAGALVFNWDAIADLFPENLLNSMFTAYDQLLHQLAEDEAIWNTSPQLAPIDQVEALNQTDKVLDKGDFLLHELFFEQAKQHPEHPAVIAPAKTLTYAALAERSKVLAHQLKQLGVQPNKFVAVSIEKGWEQIVAVLGILTAGAAYVPVNPALPQARRWQIIEDMAAEIVLVSSGNSLDWPTGLTQICIKEKNNSPLEFTTECLQSPTDLAYVIYTSGSTGTPKGVMIDHQGAVNTILDVNQRFEVGPSDRILALSSLSFDLSVYDIFGSLAAGATLVMPAAQQEKNPVHWRSLLKEHNVTIWNSVPALMQLLTTEFATAKEENHTLRLALLSGDWIPLTLPNQIKQQFPATTVISLGGATEASIWSIFYPIESVNPDWRSIPYGRPLSNQQWYVLDENLNPCPPWVTGQLYIGGTGLAKGYWRRPDLTAERFANALYKTGDLGRYCLDGTLEFLGREDFQVKVNGYRIELGEVESALQQYPSIESAVVEVMGTPAELVAFVVPELNASESSLTQPLAKLDFKQKQLGIRDILPESDILELPQPKVSKDAFIRRQSHRQFLSQPIALAPFSDFLTELSGCAIANSPLPKYRYASAGSLYPIQIYLHIKANRIANVSPGWYYYHPLKHCLVKLISNNQFAQENGSGLYGPNQQLHQDSAFSLFLVANMNAVEPIYGDKSRDFCLIETGYIGQMLMEKAPDFELGLCPIGGCDAEVLRQTLGLDEPLYQPLHALVGGAIAPSWNQQWMAVNVSSNADSTTNQLTHTLKQYLKTTLPGYMVPTRYQVLSALPLTANGKIDRKALLVLTLESVAEYVAPTTSTEKKIAKTWQTLLTVEKVGIHDNFFELGGNSLTAMQLLSQLQNIFAVELTIGQLFGALTPALQAELVQPLLNKKPYIESPKSDLSGDHQAPLSFAQQRLWFVDQLQPNQTVYTIPVALRLQGEIQIDVLKRCLNEVAARHEVLRTQFVTVEGNPAQNVLPQLSFELPVVDISKTGLDNASPNLSARVHDLLGNRLKELVSLPFNLETGPLLHAQLLKLGKADHVLAITVHHIVADYWSLKVLIKEIVLLYQAFSHSQPSPLSDLPIQYADYATSQRTQLTASADQQLSYWLQQLAESPAILQLPTDRPRPSAQSFNGARRKFELSAHLSEALTQLAGRSQSTLFMTLLAAFQVLLYRYSGQTDILVGSTVSNRDRAETKDLIGLFVNNLVFRAKVTAEQPFLQFLQQVKDTAIAAYTHKDIPFEQVVDALKIERQLSHNALFQVMFILHNTPEPSFTLPEITVTALELDNSAARFDLSLDMYESKTGLTGVFEYSTDLFDASTIDRLMAHFETLLTGIVSQPELPIGLLPLLTNKEHTAFQDLNKTATDISNQCAHELIEAQVEKTPAAIALSIDHILTDDVFSPFFLPEQPWTYQQFNNKANQLARYLMAQGAEPGSRIAIAINRSAELLIALLAVLKLGGTYIPLDPTYPKSRLQYVLQDADVSLVLESEASLKSLIPDLNFSTIDLKNQTQEINQQSAENLSVSVSQNDLAYIIYTSGSTGNPKGVPIQHRSLVNLLASMAKAPGIEANDALLAVTTVAFDIATLELLLPLTVGARVAIASPETVRDSDRLIAQLESDNITLMQATPATWRLLLDAGWKGMSSLKILCGGEALDLPLAQQLIPCCHELWNLYGPTETTIWSSAIRIDETLLAKGFMPIGGPIDNTEFYVLDGQQQAVPIGVPGELYIGGAGLSQGYLNRLELTAQKFSNALYKTGDLVRRHANGTLEYMGRLDHQIKLRGFRIELGEIEAVLNDHPNIDQALVMLRSQEDGEPLLVAYCKVWPDVDFEKASQTIRQDIAKQLPAYMLPTAYVLLADFPLTPNGKINRKALPEPKTNLSTAETSPPQTETERLLATIWENVLNLSTIHTTDNFFELGGHSLLAARVIARLQPIFGVTVPLRSLFENPTLQAFAATIDATLQSNTFAPIVAIERSYPLPLSSAQQRQWVLAQLEPDSPFYNIPAALQVTGNLSLSVLKESLSLLCQRHEGLRSTFQSVDGQADLTILPTVTPEVTFLDARNANLSEQEIQERIVAKARKPFDLTNAPLMRVNVSRTGEQAYTIVLVLHHIIADAESVGMLMREMLYLYQQIQTQQAIALPTLPVQYVDYAAWQQSLDTAEQLSYWQQQLANLPPLLSLPTDYPRLATQQFEGGSYRFTLTAEQTTKLRQLGQQHGTTLFMTLMAAFQCLLYRYSDAADVVVGTPVSHRPQASLEGVLGMFVNTLVLRGDFSKDMTFAQLLQKTRTTALAAYAHQDVPFEQIIEALNVPRNWSHSPLFQVMFVWQAAKSEAISAIDNLQWTPIPLDSNTTKVDLTLSMAEESNQIISSTENCLSGKFEYRRDLFSPGTIEAMADAFCILIDSITQTPDQLVSKLSLVSKKQKQQLQQWNDTARSYPENLCLHQLFEQQVVRSPQAKALITPDQTFSYQELNTQADYLAQQLRMQGVNPNDRIGICLDRSANLIVAMLAVLKAGAAYVPLDPNYPEERLSYILKDAQVSAVITQTEYRGITKFAPHAVILNSQSPSALGEMHFEHQEEISHRPSNLAYIIYTSGSTGKPKGVAIEHRSPVALVQWANEVFSPAQLSGVLAATSVCFDLSIFEIFVPLSSGGSVILAENVLQLPTLPAAQQVTLINTVPTAIAELIRLNAIPSSVTTINLAGEPIPTTTVQQLYALSSVQQVYNLYGPSEDTTYSTYALLSPNDAVALIGKPIANTQARVLDKQNNLVPVGMPGELHLSGSGLARGYWNQPVLTAERFDSSWYKTGDLVRYRSSGQLEFLGRMDDQVKIRGFRIELGEIESVLLQHSQVVQAAVKPWTDGQDNRRLAAYVVSAEAVEELQCSQENDLRSHLQKSLPDYMLPAVFIPLKALPLMPNGKLDRKALPQPTLEKTQKVDSTTLTPTEQTLIQIWQALLGQSVGLHDNFFELGGDSILAIQAIAQAQQLGLHFSPRDLFQHSTVAQLAGIAQTQSPSQAQQTPIVGDVPLTPIQHWFFSQELASPHHWNQSVLLTVKQEIDPTVLARSLQYLVHHHDALRATFSHQTKGWQQFYSEPSETASLVVIQRTVEDVSQFITAESTAIQSSFSLQNGPLLKVIYYNLKTATGVEQRLLIVCHHLIIDGISWRILLSDLQRLYQQLAESSNLENKVQLPPKTLSCKHWVNQLESTDFTSERPYWHNIASAKLPPMPQDFPNGNNIMRTADTISVSLTAEKTARLIKQVPNAYSARIDDILLTALILTFSPILSSQTPNLDETPSLRLSLEGHGRLEDEDLSRTVGWLTTLYPVLLKIPATTDLSAAIKGVKETLRAIPQQGIGYGVLQYLQPPSEGMSLKADTPIRFNYLGQTDQLFASGWLAPASESAGAARSPEGSRDVLLEINAVISQGQLTLHWTYSRERHKEETILNWATIYIEQLNALIDHCLSADTDSGYSPTDFPQMKLAQGELDDLLNNLGGEMP